MAKLADKKTVLNLNDDCLTEIFRLLSPLDLLSLYDTCQRFRSVAAQTFPLTHKEVDLNTFCRDMYGIVKMDRLKGFLNAFGTMITSLKFGLFFKADAKLRHRILDAIVNSCSGTLKSFNFNNEREFECTVNASGLQPLFASLESLTLSGCSLDGNGLFTDCNCLVNMKVSDNLFGENTYSRPFDNIHTHLERLQLYGGILVATPVEELERLLRHQTNLRELELSFAYEYENKHPRILNTITDFCSENLKTLKLSGFNIDQTMLPQARILFGKLESLAMKECQLNVSPNDGLFSECKKLQSFAFYFGKFVETSANDMPQLKSLMLPKSVHEYGDVDLHMEEKLQFLKQHCFLEELTIWDDRRGLISEYIAENMKSLVKIRVESTHKCTTTCTALAKTMHIKKLTLCCCNCTWNDEIKDSNYSLFLKGLVSMEFIQYLDLTNVLIDNAAIEAISEFKNLRHLKLAFKSFYNHRVVLLRLRSLEALIQLIEFKMKGPWRVSDTEVINLVKKLEQLRRLSLCVDNFPQLNESYKKITKIVHKRGQSLIISFEQEKSGGGSTFMRESFVAIERDASRLI